MAGELAPGFAAEASYAAQALDAYSPDMPVTGSEWESGTDYDYAFDFGRDF